MSELIQKHDNRATIRWKLLTGASALALTAYASSANMAKADDLNRPLLWIEFSGQAEMMQGTSSPFTAPFMSIPSPDDVYGDKSFGQKQQPPRFAFGGDSKIIFQPENSDWLFSASLRYGRAHGNQHTHYQGPQVFYTGPFFNSYPLPRYAAAFSDTLVRHDEHHAILEFSAGKDVGLGAFGNDGVSTISAGVRIAQLSEKSSVNIDARPYVALIGFQANFPEYFLTGHTARSFRGIGPSLSWTASAALAGSTEDREISLDWGVDGAVLFGRQKAKIDHATHAYHFFGSKGKGKRNVALYAHGPYSYTRSRRVMAPDLDAFAAISFRLPHSKVSFGYRAEILENAFDRGINAAKKSNLTFNGPYASISIGLGD